MWENISLGILYSDEPIRYDPRPEPYGRIPIDFRPHCLRDYRDPILESTKIATSPQNVSHLARGFYHDLLASRPLSYRTPIFRLS